MDGWNNLIVDSNNELNGNLEGRNSGKRRPVEAEDESLEFREEREDVVHYAGDRGEGVLQ
jgi:hypothetical protein